MRKSNKTASDYIKEVLQHVVLLFVALIVLTPILYLVSAGFRTNQAIFGPLVDTNSWVDEDIPEKNKNKLSKDSLIKRIFMVLDGKTQEQINDIEGVNDLLEMEEVIINMRDEGKEYKEIVKYEKEKLKLVENKKKLNKKLKINMKADTKELSELKNAIKNWIYSNEKANTYKVYINAYNNWSKTINLSLKEQIDSQLFVKSNSSFSRYKYEIRTSLFNFKCFFTGEVPNAKNAKFPYMQWLINSLVIAGSVALIQVAVTALASYALSRFRFTGKKAGLMVILTVQVFPGTMAMVALYLLLQYLGNVVPAIGIDRKLGLILIYLGGGIPFNIWLVKGYFDTIPKALEESAMIDGATYWQAFTMIILPLVRPILAVITVLSFVGQYNEFVLAMVILTSQENFTLPVGLRFFMNAQQDARFGVFAACSIMGSLPIVVLWLSLQNQIISGLTGGSVKG